MHVQNEYVFFFKERFTLKYKKSDRTLKSLFVFCTIDLGFTSTTSSTNAQVFSLFLKKDFITEN